MSQLYNIYPVFLFLLFGSFICLVLEASSNPKGFKRIGSRRHIASIAVLFNLGVVSFFIYQIFYPQEIYFIHPFQPKMVKDLILYLVVLSSIIFFLSHIAAIIDLKKTKKESGEIYSLLLLLQAALIAMIITDSLLIFTIGILLISVITPAFLNLSNDRKSASQLALSLTIAWKIIVLLLLLVIILSTTYNNFSIFQIVNLASGGNSLALVILAILIIALAAIIGAAPFFFIHVEFYGKAQPFAVLSISNSLILAAVAMVVKFSSMANFAQLIVQYKMFFTIIFCLILIVASIKCIGQLQVDRMGGYLYYSQVSFIFISAMTFGLHINGAYILPLMLVNNLLSQIIILYAINTFAKINNNNQTWDYFSGKGVQFMSLSLVWILALLSLGGFPLSIGFFTRLFIAQQLAKSDLWQIAICLAIVTAISLIPIFRLIIFMFAKGAITKSNYTISFSEKIFLFMISLIIVGSTIFTASNISLLN